MPENPLRYLSRLLALVLLAVPAVSAAAAPRPATPRSGGGETVDVEIKIVPFYAVDAEGKPVWDLRSDEVELRLGGKPVLIDTFDGPAAPGGAERTGSNGLRPASRNVIFLLDSAFTSPGGVHHSITMARKLAGELSEGDRLFLMTFSVARGLEKRLGPVPADRQGKAKLSAALDHVMPEVRRLSAEGVADLPRLQQVEHNTVQNGNRDDKPTSQWMGQTDSMNEFDRSEYMSVARGLAESIDATAAGLRHLRGPKLFLMFWEGLDSDLFFDGDIGFKPGSNERISYGGQRTSGLMLHFIKPLQDLADSGAMTVFVNPSAPSDVGDDAEGPIRQIAQMAGAYYTGGGDPQYVGARVAATTAAYYEAGFYLKGDPKAARQPVEVVVKRPGVKAWAPAAVKMRETYEGLTAYEKRMLIVELVAGGPEAQRGPVRMDLHGLDGAVQSRAGGKDGRRLRYDVAWPADLNGKDVDVYSVALAPPAKGQKTPTILQFDSKEKARAGALPLEVSLAKGGEMIWGIVAVDPGTGQAWYRRLQLQGEKEAK
jgi:hypothetical protein